MPVSDDDQDLWQAYAKGVKRARRAPDKTTASSRKTLSPAARPPQANLSGVRSKVPERHSSRAVSFDRKIERRLRDGAIVIDARLDLHGLTQTEAHAALAQFITAQIKKGGRNLLIITGKGRGGDGVLRASLAVWLGAIPAAAHILAVRPAAAKHGGDGAFYVILKKPKGRA